MDYKNKKLDVVPISPYLKIMMPENLAVDYKQGKFHSFSDYLSELIELLNKNIKIDSLPPFVFSLFVLSPGEEFQTLTKCPFSKGMCGIHSSLSKDYPIGLAMDSDWFCTDIPEESKTRESKIALIHELSHTLHSAFFQNLGQVMEGVAELIPHYMLNLRNEKHLDAVASIRSDDIKSMAYLNQNGMFYNPEDKSKKTQYKTSYISAYLWMLGYINSIEVQKKCDKWTALNLALKHFKQADTMQFSSEKEKHIANLIQIDVQTLFGTNKMQINAKKKLTIVNNLFRKSDGNNGI